MKKGVLSHITLRDITFRNRLGMSPMCTYSAHDGCATPWHQVHLGSRAQGGLGLIWVEATAVSPEGRITLYDLGLWKDAHVDAFVPLVQMIESQGAVPGIQIAHAGRKALCSRPWEGGKPLAAEIIAHAAFSGDFHGKPWSRVGPSELPFSPDFPVPQMLDKGEIREIVKAFGQSAARAHRAGFKILEIHSAHGYLLHSFLSPISNVRTDNYGGSLAQRMAFLEEVVLECRRHWGQGKPMGVRLSMCDWQAPGTDGLIVDDTVRVAKRLGELGVDFVDCSSGGSIPNPVLTPVPLYQVPFARRVKQEAQIASMAVGLITTLEQAQEIVQSEAADFVLLGRVLLRDPYWLLRALRAERSADSKVSPDAVVGLEDQEIIRGLIPLPYRRGF
jgi:2,4-dienoyl-CoA reductase-like NADH-dependent reductase (Old Yellow Enzyme family)